MRLVVYFLVLNCREQWGKSLASNLACRLCSFCFCICAYFKITHHSLQRCEDISFTLDTFYSLFRIWFCFLFISFRMFNFKLPYVRVSGNVCMKIKIVNWSPLQNKDVQTILESRLEIGLSSAWFLANLKPFCFPSKCLMFLLQLPVCTSSFFSGKCWDKFLKLTMILSF